MTPAQKAMHDLCALIRSIYVDERRRFETIKQGGVPSNYGDNPRSMVYWDGGIDTHGNHRVSVWPRIAQFTLTNKITPEELVRGVFMFWTMLEHAPKPTQLYREDSLSAALRYREFSQDDLKCSIESAKAAVRSAFIERQAIVQGEDETVSWRSVVSGPVCMPPLFRYCLLLQLGFQDLATEHRVAAVMDYISRQDQYESILGEFIPRSLQEEARQVRENVLRIEV